MNRSTHANSKTKNRISASGAWTAVAILLICVMLTSSVAGACIELFADKREPDTVISILPPEGNTAQRQTQTVIATASFTNGAAALSAASRARAIGQRGGVSLASYSFYVSDDRQVWGTNTDIDIFRASYENGAGVITAAGRGGDKIVAPGTSNTYLFYLTNDGSAAIDYEMDITATLSDNLAQYTVPVRVRLSDNDGAWLCGGPGTWENFIALDGTHKQDVLGARSYAAYSLEWEWPFESGDDALDTFLGNLALGEDLVLTIQINITAEYNPEPGASGGTPQTGDTSRIELWVLLMALSLAGIIVMVMLGKRKDKETEV